MDHGELFDDEELQFDESAISQLATDTVTNVIGDKLFTEKNSQIWMQKIIESMLTHLQTLNKPFKYIVTVLLEQKTGTAFSGAADCRWDASKDGHCCIDWTNDSTHAVVTIFGLYMQ